MSSREARYYWGHKGLMLLMGGLLLAPLAWFLDLQISYATVKWACASGRRELMLLIPIGSLSLIAVAGAMSWSCWRKLRGEGRLEGGQMEDRSYFLALAGLAMSGVFALLVLTSLLPRYMLSPCE